MEKIKLAVHTGIRYKCTGCGQIIKREHDCQKHIKRCKLSNIYALMEKIELDVNSIQAETRLQCQFC